MKLADALRGKDIPPDIRESLALIEVPYISFPGELKHGYLVLRRDLGDEIRAIFSTLAHAHFPIEKIIPICDYDWDDESSMADNNSSAFNYRTIAGTDRLSNHAFGCALDINPYLNPYICADIVAPQGATYDPSVPGTIVAGDTVTETFRKYGWRWGGDWTDRKDWQHFEKQP